MDALEVSIRLRMSFTKPLINGSIPAATFYLDRRGGWKQTIELTGKDGGPITLAAMREAFAAEIEGTAKPVSKKKAKPKEITDETNERCFREMAAVTLSSISYQGSGSTKRYSIRHPYWDTS